MTMVYIITALLHSIVGFVGAMVPMDQDTKKMML
jgi:hypothetical protein